MDYTGEICALWGDLFTHVDELDLFVKLIESGEKEKLMELLRERLIECGWRDEMKALCRFVISLPCY